jgi:hypothetical protein
MMGVWQGESLGNHVFIDDSDGAANAVIRMVLQLQECVCWSGLFHLTRLHSVVSQKSDNVR